MNGTPSSWRAYVNAKSANNCPLAPGPTIVRCHLNRLDEPFAVDGLDLEFELGGAQVVHGLILVQQAIVRRDRAGQRADALLGVLGKEGE